MRPPQNTDGFVWEISASPYPSKYLAETREFGAANPCYLIDQYSGRQPALINREFVERGKFEFAHYPSAILDSNLASQVHAVANGGKASDGFRMLLDFLTAEGWDFGLNFYYLEHLCKAKTRVDFVVNAIARTRALLTLHTMDEREYLRTGRVVQDSSAVEHYLHEAGATTLDEVASRRVHRFCANFSRQDCLQLVEAIEVALIKMFLLRRIEMTKAEPLRQLDAFSRFLERDLRIIMGREKHLALHYFHDRAGSLLGVQPNTRFDAAIANVMSTAWDMVLLRLPELFFSASATEMCLPYVATQEKQLARLARLFSVEAIIGNGDGALVPVVGYVTEGLPEPVPCTPQRANAFAEERKEVPAGLRHALVAELRRVLDLGQ